VDEKIGTSEIVERSGMGKPTVLHYMKALGHLGLVEFGESEFGYFVVLRKPYEKLIDEPLEAPKEDQTMKELGNFFDEQGRQNQPVKQIGGV